MKPGAVAVLVVLLLAGCSSYDATAAPRGAKVHLARQPSAATVLAATEPPQPAAPGGQPQTGAPLPAAAVLHAWDRRRAHAWATGDVQALADLYTARSAAGRADVELLTAYLHRGLRVTGLRMQVFAVRVLGHQRRRWLLLVTDRLARAVAVGAGGAVTLPRDTAAARVIDLVRGPDGHWRVAAVRPVRP